MPTNIQWPPIGGTTYPIPTSGETNWPVLTNFLVALQNAQGTGSQKIAIRVATSTPVTVSSSLDCVVGVDLTVPGPSEVHLPPGIPGQWLCISDRAGTAASYPIKLIPDGSETIAGLPELEMNQNGASIIIGADGTGNWLVIAQAAGEGTGGGISRSALDATNPNWVLINNGSGLMSQERYLSAVRGGLGVDASALAGYIKMAGGVASAVAAIAASDIGPGTVSDTEFGYLAGVTSSIQTQLDGKQAAGSYQPLDPDLTALAGLSGNGFAVRTASDTWANRSLAAGSSKLSVTNPEGVAGNPTIDVVEANLTLDNIGGTLGIAKGGTGQTSASAALNALLPTQTGNNGKVLQTDGSSASWQSAGSTSPLTTKGDLYGFSTVNARLPVGTNGQVLTADSSQTLGVKWDSAPAGGLTPVPVSTSGTIAPNTEENVDCSGGPITRQLPPLPGPSDDPISVLVLDTGSASSSNKITILPASGDRIDAPGLMSDDGIAIDYARGWIAFYAAPNASSWKIQTQATTTVQPATPTLDGVVKKNRWQQKFYSGTTSTPGVLLTMNNLVIGKTYEVLIQGRTDSAAASIYSVVHNGNNIANCSVFASGAHYGNCSVIFTAAATTVTMNLNQGNINGDGSANRTWMAIRELNTDESTTVFT